MTALFVSCASERKSPDIKDIVNQWIDIEQLLTAFPESHTPKNSDFVEKATLLEMSDVFYQSLQQFQRSDLYRIYRAIPFSRQTERSFNLYPITDIQEVSIVSDLALLFRNSIVSGDMEKAKTVSAEIAKYIIHLLIIDGEAQRYISASYFHLLIAFIFFISIIVLLIRFLHQSLTRSLKREAEGTIFSHAYMLAQDEERARISRELHDTIIQDMRCLLLETEKIGNTNEKNEREKLSGKTVPMMADLIRKTRDICSSLIPPDFRFSELPDAIRQLCHDFGERTGVDCRAEIDENIKLEFLAMEKRLQVFRVIQEALANIEKHAEAKEAIVTMRSGEDGIVYIGIGDDGKGFTSPLDNAGQIINSIDKSHIGIISMKERAAILGGRLKIVSAPASEREIGEGTLVCLEIPGSQE
ncbi:MAG: histidine kinase [Treponema sp.]|nr:histidine kinase [Treponema sp.]